MSEPVRETTPVRVAVAAELERFAERWDPGSKMPIRSAAREVVPVVTAAVLSIIARNKADAATLPIELRLPMETMVERIEAEVRELEQGRG